MTATGSSASNNSHPPSAGASPPVDSLDPKSDLDRSPHADNGSPALHVVLYQPQIPQNTGNIARTCVALRAKLWIVRPTMFRLDSSQLKRAGLDYWQYLSWEVVDSWDDLISRFDHPRLWLVSKFGTRPYYDTEFQHGDLIVLGRETDGLPASLREQYRDQMIQIPMPGEVRSLNQANAAAIVMYEAARRIGVFAACTGENTGVSAE